MKCTNCQTYYVRDPCTNCGQKNSKTDQNKDQTDDSSREDNVKPSQIRQRETSSGPQVLIQEEERLVKPSQRFRQEKEKDEELPSFQRFEQKQEDDEQLVKPSERFKKEEKDEDIPSFKRFEQKQDDDEQLVKPSERRLKEQDEDDIPSFQRYQRDEEVDVSNISKLNKPEQQEKLKNDKEYRNKVKETLEEVMGLLEKLIEED